MDIALSGIRAASMRMAVSAHNVANWITPDYRAYRAVQSELPTQRGTMTRVVRTESPTDLASEMVEQLLSLRYMQANGVVIRRQAEMTGTIINLWG